MRTAHTVEESTKPVLVGTPEQVMARLEPHLQDGVVTDVMICAFNGLCGVEHTEGSGKAINRLVHVIEGSEITSAETAYASLV